jgi:hypothetical protein
MMQYVLILVYCLGCEPHTVALKMTKEVCEAYGQANLKKGAISYECKLAQ